MKNCIRAFVGTSIVNPHKGTYALTIISDDGQFYMPTRTISDKNTSSYRLTLRAFLDLLRGLNKTKINTQLSVFFYANDDLIAHEFNIELKQEDLSSKTKSNDDLWQEIIKNYKKMSSKIDVSIKGTDTILRPLNKQVIRRTYRRAER